MHLGKLKKFITSSHDPLVSLVKGIHRSQATLNNAQFLKPIPCVSTKAPNNIYVDMRKHKVYEALFLSNNVVKMKEYTNLIPFFTDPVTSFLVGCYKAHLNSWRCVYMEREVVLKLRHGIKIEMDNFPGLSDPTVTNHILFMGLLHDSSDTLY